MVCHYYVHNAFVKCMPNALLTTSQIIEHKFLLRMCTIHQINSGGSIPVPKTKQIKIQKFLYHTYAILNMNYI